MVKDGKAHGRFSAWMEHNQGHVQQCARGYGEWRVATDAKVLSGLNGPRASPG